ncbi:MAG: gliding motility lipoprotein GldB, partial [Bacteroidetes bacterium]
YTATSDIDYKNKVLVADSILILELDTYLGSDHPFYGGISKYITKNMKPSMVATDVAAAYSRTFIEVPKQRMLLAQMIFFGKELYLKDLWLPSATDAEKIGYTEAEWRWAQENEEYIWRFLIEKELLYSTDARLPSRFINPAPFSKFNLEIDNESPGMIGRYVGWKIVRAYMKNNDVNLQQLMRQHPEDLFKNSKYKPKK